MPATFQPSAAYSSFAISFNGKSARQAQSGISEVECHDLVQQAHAECEERRMSADFAIAYGRKPRSSAEQAAGPCVPELL